MESQVSPVSTAMNDQAQSMDPRHHSPQRTGSLVCALCSCELSRENDSSEHVIPNAIGGRLKVQGLFCRNCNSAKGAAWDAALAKQLNVLCVLLGVKRERGKVPDEAIRQPVDRELLLQADGELKLRHPSVNIPTEPRPGETLDIKVEARSPGEAKRIVKELEAHYAKKGARLRGVTIKDEYRYDIEPPTFMVSIGGGGSSHSIVKIALAFAHHCGVHWKDCEQACQTFAGEIEPCFGYYAQREDVIVREHPAPRHYLVLRGCSDSRLLLCYVELFSVHRMIVCLSLNYTGEDITHTYGVDPTSGEAAEVRMDFDFGLIAIDKLYNYEFLDTDLLRDEMDRLGPIIMKRSMDLAFTRAVKDSIKYAQERTKFELGSDYIEGTLDPRIATQRIMPFFEHLAQLRRHARSPAQAKRRRGTGH